MPSLPSGKQNLKETTMPKFTHIDDKGHVRMVDVTDKRPTLRTASAQGVVVMSAETFDRIFQQRVQKGNVLETARIAGIMAAKKTSDLIPMCHPLNITHVEIDFFPDKTTHSIRLESMVRIIDQTGVEMEALMCVSVACLTIYDMCKSYDKAITVTDIYLLKKSGGKSGTFIRKEIS
jgi:cyclic pyranopterin phosphate synthase